MNRNHDPRSGPPLTAAASRFRLARLLVPLDFSAAGVEALRFALPFARECGARVDLLHVLPPLALPAEAAHLPPHWDRLEVRRQAEAQRRLRRLLATEVGRRWRGEALTRAGQPAAVIAAVARERGSDWVVVSTQGHTGLKRFLLGSTAEGVVRAAPCPVLSVRRRVLARRGTPQAPPSERINRVLVPVDFRPASRELLAWAGEFARRFHASLVLLHVVERVSLPTRMAYLATRVQMVVLERGLRRLAEWAEHVAPPEVKASRVVLFGAPYAVINQTARREQVDLIVLATRGRTGLRRPVLGSVAERVVRHAPCPVLVLRPARNAAGPRGLAARKNAAGRPRQTGG